MTTAILKIRPPVAPNDVPGERGKRDFLRLVALDRPRAEWQRLVCRWRLDGDGRLSCVWEPDRPRIKLQ